MMKISNMGRGILIHSLWTLLILTVILSTASISFATVLTVSNPVISASIDSSKGGAITSFKVNGVEVVNNSNLGRQFQFDLRDVYLGWDNYNPTQAGDSCGDASTVLEFYTVNSRTLHAMTQAREWSKCTDSDAQITFEPTIGDGSDGYPYQIMEMWAAWYSSNDHTFSYYSATPALSMNNQVLTRLFTYFYL